MFLAKKHDQLLFNLEKLYTAGTIVAYLNYHGFIVWRQNTTCIYDNAKARWRIIPKAAAPPISSASATATATSLAS